MSSFRLPQNLSTQLSLETGESRLQQEIMAEQAAALGNAGRKVGIALQRLKEFDAGKLSDANRSALVGDAADAVWGFFVQRELIGLRDQQQTIQFYGIPGEVLNRMGARPTSK